MEKLPKVFIIILNYNGKDTIKMCLESVFKSDYPNFEVVVVDNASKDGSFKMARNFFSRAHFILNDRNIGFAAGNNVAIRFALEKMADYIFLLNNDAVLESDALSKLIEEVGTDKKAGISSPIIHRPDGSIWFSGGKIKWFQMKTEHIFEILSDVPYETEYVTGCAMLIKKDIFRKISLLNEKYFLYYEDADFCLRARHKGFECLVVPSAKVTHFEKSESNPKSKIYWLVLSGIIFFKENSPAILKPWISFYLILRKMKNWGDVNIKKDGIAKITQKAYRDYNALH